MNCINIFGVVVTVVFLVACNSTAPKPASINKLSLQNISGIENKAEFQPVCLNKSQSKVAFVYLHGMDIADVSGQEKANREKLFRIAQKLEISVVVPRAISICPTSPNQVCWGWKFDQAELTQIKERISSAIGTCGAKKVIALVGFSNGGYAVNALHSRCEADEFGKLISIGAMMNTPVTTLKYNQGCAGTILRLIGKQDNLNSNLAAVKLVTENNFEKLIQIIEFDGGHEIPESLLQEQLQIRLLQIH